ncbi:MAG: long-chain fatty acid--CoA ligase [Candidatus Schekmanbacteria bacterium]|nr:MAG: long-chain fatty acid--CoA ligase [Candidatus Schekmanbacteria bacterium]
MSLVKDFLYTHLSLRGEKTFLKENTKECTFIDTASNILDYADALLNLGIKCGERIVLILPNSSEFVFFYYASALTGIISVPVDTRYGISEISQIIDDCDPKAIFCFSSYKKKNYKVILDEIYKNREQKDQIIFLDETPLNQRNKYPFQNEKSNILRRLDEYKPLSIDEPFVILYTSGSTGKPKGVLLNQRNLIKNSLAVNSRLKITDKDIFLLIVPFSHAFGSSVLLNNAFTAGSTIIILDVFDPEESLSLIKDENVTLLYAVPTQVVQLCEEMEKSVIKKTSLRTGYISGASCTPELIELLEKKFGCKACIAYGMTEASCISISSPDDDLYVRSKSAGKAVEGTMVKIVDDEKNKVKNGMSGEIAIKGESVMKAYYRNKEIEDWFYTGDIGVIDDEGNLKILGRKKDLIIRGGFNIFPGEIERHLMNHDFVEIAAVFGIEDKTFGEKIVACVKTKEKSKVSGEELSNFCKQFLASYKIPDYIIFVDSFPLTASAKIKKEELKSLVIKELSNERKSLTIFENF